VGLTATEREIEGIETVGILLEGEGEGVGGDLIGLGSTGNSLLLLRDSAEMEGLDEIVGGVIYLNE